MKQKIIITALPNGTVTRGSGNIWKVSAAIGLQVEDVDNTLQNVKDMLGWASLVKNAKFIVQLNGNPVEAKVVSKPVDTDTGLSYFGSRYYDPTVGRFYEIDPQVYSEGNVHSFNRYAYANNNPLKYTDPDGHSPVDLAFLAYDVYNLGKTIYQGGAVGGALLDVGICTAYFCR